MAINSTIWKVLLAIFAGIGVLTVLILLGIAFMHGGMMSMMGSFSDMAAACQRMMMAQ